MGLVIEWMVTNFIVNMKNRPSLVDYFYYRKRVTGIDPLTNDTKPSSLVIQDTLDVYDYENGYDKLMDTENSREFVEWVHPTQVSHYKNNYIKEKLKNFLA